MDAQAELGLFMASSRTADELTDELIARLELTKQWTTRKEVQKWMSDRECRLARANAKGRIISGQGGYKLTKYATLEEVRQAANTLHSMATVLLAQEQELWRVLHGRGAAVENQTEKAGDTV